MVGGARARVMVIKKDKVRHCKGAESMGSGIWVDFSIYSLVPVSRKGQQDFTHSNSHFSQLPGLYFSL